MNIVSDLRGGLNTVRDQGERPTCMAFAATTAHEFVRPTQDVLSPQWIAYHANSRAKNDIGMTFSTLHDVISHDGQVNEAECRYQPIEPADSWAPSNSLNGTCFGELQSTPQHFKNILSEVEAGMPVILGIGINRPFYTGGMGTPKRIDTGPSTAGLRLPGHAVVACGSGTIGTVSYLLIRNSWGPTWGDDGYCWLSENYLSSVFLAAVTLKEIQP